MPRARGTVLIVVLFVMTVLALVAVSFAYRAGLDSRTVRHRAVMIQLEAQARSAVAIAIARLRANTNDFDHWAESWHSHRPLAAEDWLAEWQADALGRPPVFVADYHVIDEEGKLNIRYASSQALESLGMSAVQIASLFDWMDTDDIAAPEGAEEQYYLSLPSPYRCKDAPLESLDELLLVRGFELADYLGEDANHNGQLDPAENDGASTYPADNADGQLRLGWLELLTLRGDGRININTAGPTVLATLPLSEGAAKQIIDFRRFDADSSGDLAEHVFRSPADIVQLQGLTDADKDMLGSLATYRSEHFRILAESRHLPSGMSARLEVLVRVGGESIEILQWKVSQ